MHRPIIGGVVMTLATLCGAAALAQTAPADKPTASYPPEATGDGPVTNGYSLSRWAEDWRSFRDRSKIDDPIDRLKYIPLDPDGDAWLTLSGEARVRMNLTTNPQLRDAQAQRQDIGRLVGGADLHVGEHFRMYGELASGYLGGRNLGNPAATLRNDLIAQQLFVEASGQVGDAAIGTRIGRQEFTDGPNLMTSQRDNNTIRFVLNGVRAWARGKTVRADLFDFRYTRYGSEGLGDDPTDGGHRFSGITIGTALPTSLFGGSKLYVDPLFWRLRSRDQAWGTGTGREERLYYGAHIWGSAGPVALDWTLTRQEGSYQGRDIDAWQIFLAQTYRIGKGAEAPRVGVHADYGSGGGAYGTGKLRNGFAPFGNNIYYSYGLFLTPTNFIGVSPNISFTPIKGVRVTSEYQKSWRENEQDAVYRSNGTPYVGTQLVGGKSVAQLVNAQFVYTITPRLSYTLRLEHLWAGQVLRDAGYHDSSFIGSWLSYRF